MPSNLIVPSVPVLPERSRPPTRLTRTSLSGAPDGSLTVNVMLVGAAAVAALAAYRTSGADYADCLLGLLNRDLGCATTVTFDADAATLPEFQAL